MKTGERFISFWIEFTVDHHETGKGTDNYLSEILAWWSSDGKVWERQPNRYELFTGGTIDAIAKYANIEALVDDSWSNTAVMVAWVEKFAARKTLRIENGISVNFWAVDTGNIQREFDFGEEFEMPRTAEFKKLWKIANKNE